MTDRPTVINVYDPDKPASTAEVANLRMLIDSIFARIEILEQALRRIDALEPTVKTPVPEPTD